MIEAAVAAVVAFVVSAGWSTIAWRLQRRKFEAAKAKLFGGR